MKMSKAANYMLGVSGAIVVGIWAIASLGEDAANGVPQAAAPVVPASVAATAVEVKLVVQVATRTDKLASAYSIESCQAELAPLLALDPIDWMRAETAQMVYVRLDYGST